MSKQIQIRDAKKSDAPTILQFITELAIYEKEPDAVKTDEQAIIKTLFSEGATAHSVICLEDDEPIGFAVYFYNYSTWLGKNGLYLEDLYVSPDSRGNGAGKLIMKHLANKAIKNDCGRFEWVVLDWNQPAIDFYNSIGAKAQNEWIIYRLAGQDLLDFAEQ
ncbi:MULTISPECIES: GNAT family N-acetyltransferase [Pseudoalteromonas]|jgi:GNAT superfamily N-acetyltransferase|uniref:GNAT family N-acetyltransferase n=1 Tax=Pseudoalteromonas agarivorans TaxID=176102 RepID=A0AAD0U3S2_9GAMM|nr:MULTISPECIES: GNAT family N-acetyltransferase [Pseudoalteromonas]AYM88521.1 GNAT family N-acetyltransferase [Pseudoalteromonas agarivorans]KPV93134.1 Acetyltransferase (GNAT) family protein [Pseudoalteromonas sp. P1-30]MCK8105744.1 GNAT family N-acetyltransferase [Pseudoalteromonas sp. 2CM41L]MDC9500321.1 GNAT family N-acetyltransferase [Pseudoalteromonas sp. Angola-18]MDC9512101.1 GNAT family N-acetyltransferase [Pseudoalteromonas sp. CST1]|tara:strand:- start:73 stop:558 length:486 start_codon:yes stop_codon:yes gene_type:complete